MSNSASPVFLPPFKKQLIQNMLSENSQLINAVLLCRKDYELPDRGVRYLHYIRQNLVQLGSMAYPGEDFEMLLPPAPEPKIGMTTRSMSLTVSTEKNVDESPNNFSRLPTAIVAAIFLHLDVPDRCRVALVCVSWRDVVYRQLLWRDTVIEVPPVSYSRLTLRSLAERGVRHLKLRRTRGIRDLLINDVPILRGLDLSQCTSVSDRTFPEKLLDHLEHLSELDLSNARKLTDEGLSMIARHRTTLVTLNLSFCQQLTDASVSSIAAGLRRLRHLDLSGCNLLTDAGVAHLAGCVNDFESNGECPALLSLSVAGCTRLSNKSLMLLSWGQTSLSRLDIASCAFGSLGMRHLDKLTSLRQLVMAECDSVGINGLSYLTRVTGLVALDMRGCSKIGEVGLKFMGQLPNLRRLVLHSCDIGDAGLAHMADGGSNVIFLDLGKCLNITDEGLRHVSRLTSLRDLCLAGCEGVTGKGLGHLACGEARIASLDLTGCTYVLSDHLLPFLSVQTELRRLVLDDQQSSVEGLSLAANLHRLQSYVVAGQNLMERISCLRDQIRRDATNGKQ